MLSHPILHLYYMQKKVFIPVILLFIIISGFTKISLPVKKVHAYKQASIPGILPGYTEENDVGPAKKTKPKQNFNYWFYIEIAKTEKINVTGLWIAGIPHNIKSETVVDLPVRKIILTGMEKNDTTIMMPATKNNVMLIYPSGESKDTIIRSKYIRDIARINELVIRYSWKNRVYYTTVKRLKELNPDVRQ